MPFSPVILSEMGVLLGNGNLAFTGIHNHMCFKVALHLLLRRDFGSGQVPVEVGSSESASGTSLVCDGEQIPQWGSLGGGDLGCESFRLIKSLK